MYAAQGWDSVTIDMQHGAGNINDAVPMMVAIQSGGDATPLVRVPWNDPGQIMRALDAGAMGIICPMINTKAEAEALVRAGRYPPMGERSFGPYRAVAIRRRLLAEGQRGDPAVRHGRDAPGREQPGGDPRR